MSFILAELDAQSIPRARELPVAAAQAFLRGAALLVNASNQYAECGADPAAIAAIAESDYGTDTGGFGGHGTKEFPPGHMQGTLLEGRKFRARYVGSLPAADGGSYGIVKDADGLWKVDFTDTTATRVKLVGRLTQSPENQAEVFVRFLTANIQIF
jgi:hypothetical protein